MEIFYILTKQTLFCERKKKLKQMGRKRSKDNDFRFVRGISIKI